MTSNIVYEGNLRTVAKHSKSGQILFTDAPIDNRGKGEGFSPTDLVCTALGSCMLTIMGIKALDHNLNIEGASAEIVKEMADNPRRISRIKILIRVPNHGLSVAQQSMLTQAAIHCPVAKSLEKEIVQEVNFEFFIPES